MVSQWCEWSVSSVSGQSVVLVVSQWCEWSVSGVSGQSVV